MKNHAHVLLRALALLALLSTLNLQPLTAFAQGTAFTYQGRLNSGGSPANGSYDVAFTLYATNQTGVAVAGPVTNLAVAVSNGLFTATVDFGPGVFTGQNYWLDLAVRTNGGGAFAELDPRQPILPTPYAIMAGSASNLLGTLATAQLSGTIPATQLSGIIPSADISGTYSNPVNFNNGANTFDGTFYGQFLGLSFIGGNFSGQFIGDGSGLININPSHIAGQVAYLNSNQVFTAQNIFTQPVGIGNPSPLPFYALDVLESQSNVRLQTTNSANGATVELRNTTTNNYVEYLGAINFNNAANIYPGQIGYFSYPAGTTPDYFGLRVGGWDQSFKLVADPYGAGANSLINGYFNSANSVNGADFIGSGYQNVIQAGAGYSTILNGYQNTIQTNSSYSTIAGGFYNNVQGFDTFIGGGYGNTNITAYGVIGGGYNNLIQGNNWGAFIGGGAQNLIQFGAGYSAICSGSGNLILTNSLDSVIGSGYYNTIQPNAGYSAIGGGYYNVVQSNAYASAIGGGGGNVIQTNADHATIAGGYNNLIQVTAWDSAIAGGYGNVILPFAQYSFIGGGNVNTNSSSYSVIGGGDTNDIQPAASYSIIGGGVKNVIQGDSSVNFVANTIGGGLDNSIQTNSSWSTVGGGSKNYIGQYATASAIDGGWENTIQGDYAFWSITFPVGATIAGGIYNAIQTNSPYATIGGGVENVIGAGSIWSTIAGGAANQIELNATAGFIGGGEFNIVGSSNSVVAGGLNNTATGIESFAAGTYAQATNDGSFVLTDDAQTFFYSTASNQLSARFTGGVRFVTSGAGMTLDGQPILAGTVNPGQLSGAYTNAVTFSYPANNFYGIFYGNGTGLNYLNASQLIFGTVPPGILSGSYTNSVTFTNAGNVFAGNGTGLTNVNAATLGGLASSNFWTTTGNAGTTPGVNYIGTSDGKNLLIRGGFVGVGRTNQITSAEFFGVEAPVGANTYGGMYVDTASTTGLPFYGYSQGGKAIATYHFVDGNDTNKWKLVVNGYVPITAMANGFVGIGTQFPDANLSVNGTADKPGGGSWTTFSDGRLKDVGPNFTHGLEALEKIQPVSYHYKADNPLNLPSQPEYVGVVAQQVQKAVPEAVQQNKDGYLTVNNDPIIWTMVNAIKELNRKVDQKEAENAQLKQQLADLELRVQQLAQARQNQ